MPHEAKPPELGDILRLLDGLDVQFVIVGSCAALLYGVDVRANDLDIVPATDPGNLSRLSRALDALEARPAGPFGTWTQLPGGELSWVARPTTEAELEAWAPDISDAGSFDHRFRTRHGDFDVVPSIAGTYGELKCRAIRLGAFGHQPWVAHVDDLLARLTIPRRDKDAPRVAMLREIQRTRGENRG